MNSASKSAKLLNQNRDPPSPLSDYRFTAKCLGFWGFWGLGFEGLRVSGFRV